MDASPSFGDLVFDPLKCSKLSMDQRKEIVYEVSNWSDSAMEILHSWSRQEILQVLCAEMGKERKYTGLTKSKMIELLLKVVYEKKAMEQGSANASDLQPSCESGERTPKRQRKSDAENGVGSGSGVVCCKNSACKAKMSSNDAFCRRCSCCICQQYDDNKDPSLWLTCNSDPPFDGVCCGMSCHLECALRHENSGISKDRQDAGLDGSFCCVSCGKVNDLLSSWRKQLVVARDTRRVDILRYRLSLCQKILTGTKHYQNLRAIIGQAVQKLEEEMGPLTDSPVKKARGIVNRLSSGPEIQRVCASAVESLDAVLCNRSSNTLSGCDMSGSKHVRFEDISASSLRVILSSDDLDSGEIFGYMLWHRKSDDIDYPAEPTRRLFLPSTKFLLTGLMPATEYCLKVVILHRVGETATGEFRFRTGNSGDATQYVNGKSSDVERSQSPATNCSSLSNPSSVEDETNNVMLRRIENGGENRPPFSNPSQTATTLDVVVLDEECIRNQSDTLQTDSGRTPYVDGSEVSLQVTPCEPNHNCDEGTERGKRIKSNGKDIAIPSKGDGEPQAGSSLKKRGKRVEDGERTCGGIRGDKDFEYYVKMIRWLERDGHMESAFRQKLLTWYSLHATPREARVVKAFVDAFGDDPESLTQQLVDTFGGAVSSKRAPNVAKGFCMKLWH